MSSPLIEKFSFHFLSFIILFILFIIFLYQWLVVVFQTKKNLPPGAPRLPIIRNLHQLGKFPHHSLRSLSQKYGDYMLLYLGNRPTLVVSSTTAAEHIMKTHDVIFANRPKTMAINKIIYGANDVIFNTYNEKWRQLKSICVTKLLNNKRVQSSRLIREEEVGGLIEEIKTYNGSVINLSNKLFKHFEGLICKTALGWNYHNDSDGFSEMVKELSEVVGQISVGDYVPLLHWIDKLNGLEARAENLRKRFDKFVQQVINQHLDAFNDGRKDENDDAKDIVDVLLEIQQEKT